MKTVNEISKCSINKKVSDRIEFKIELIKYKNFSVKETDNLFIT